MKENNFHWTKDNKLYAEVRNTFYTDKGLCYIGRIKYYRGEYRFKEVFAYRSKGIPSKVLKIVVERINKLEQRDFENSIKEVEK